MGFAFIDKYDVDACAQLCNTRGPDGMGGACQYFNIWRAVVSGVPTTYTCSFVSDLYVLAQVNLPISYVSIILSPTNPRPTTLVKVTSKLPTLAATGANLLSKTAALNPMLTAPQVISAGLNLLNSGPRRALPVVTLTLKSFTTTLTRTLGALLLFWDLDSAPTIWRELSNLRISLIPYRERRI